MTNVLTPNREALTNDEEISIYLYDLVQKIDQLPTSNEGEIYFKIPTADGSTTLLMREPDSSEYSVSVMDTQEYNEDTGHNGGTIGSVLSFTPDLRVSHAKIIAMGNKGGGFERKIKDEQLLGFVRSITRSIA